MDMSDMLDLRKLTAEQRQGLEKLYTAYVEENQKKEQIDKEKRQAKNVSIDELQRYLFENRLKDGDIYLDVDHQKYPGCMVNEESMQIRKFPERKVVAEFTYGDFIPCCDHLPEHVLNELEMQVARSTGGNYSSWDDIHQEAEQNPSSLLGYHTLENGLTCYGMYGTDDGNWSVFFILYIDEQSQLRGYIPKKGNQYCTECNEAWPCSHLDSDDFELFEETLYKKLKDSTYFQYEEMKQDILTAIRVKEN